MQGLVSYQFTSALAPTRLRSQRSDFSSSDAKWLLSADRARFKVDRVLWQRKDGTNLLVEMSNCHILYRREDRPGDALNYCAGASKEEWVKSPWIVGRITISQVEVSIRDVIHNIYTHRKTNSLTRFPTEDYEYVPVPELEDTQLEFDLVESPTTIPTTIIAFHFYHTFSTTMLGGTGTLSLARLPSVHLFTEGSWHTEYYSNLSTLFNTRGEEFSIEVAYQNHRPQRVRVVGNIGNCRETTEDRFSFPTSPSERWGGYLGKDSSNLLAFALPETNFQWKRYDSVMLLAPADQDRLAPFRCKRSETVPAPLDGLTYASGAPSLVDAVERTMYLLGE